MSYIKVMHPFSVIFAADAAGGIGKDGTLPWRVKEDMKFFKDTTLKPSTSKIDTTQKKNVVLMGRKTWDSIPAKFRPLPDRINVILSEKMTQQDVEDHKNTYVVNGGLDVALEWLARPDFVGGVDRVFLTGGAALIQEAVTDRKYRVALHHVHLTRIEGTFDCDVKVDFDGQAMGFSKVSATEAKTVDDVTYRFEKYTRVNKEERQYLDLVQEILEEGVEKGDRTGTGTISKFGAQSRYSLRDGRLPLLTTKRVFWKGVAEELFWFIKGCTDGKVLSDMGVGIWDGNGTKEFLESRGLGHREEGDLGPIYGFQWRHFGAAYTDCHADYAGQGKDQLADIIDKIKNNPNDRRIIMSAWNPMALDEMALPPCHVMCQFYVANGELSCQMYQRSCDMGLGVPFNIASYSLLTIMIADICGLKPGDFVHTMGDAHVYSNHVEPLKQQLKREPRPFPTIQIMKKRENIEDYELSDFKILEYNPYPTIKMEMAV